MNIPVLYCIILHYNTDKYTDVNVNDLIQGGNTDSLILYTRLLSVVLQRMNERFTSTTVVQAGAEQCLTLSAMGYKILWPPWGWRLKGTSPYKSRKESFLTPENCQKISYKSGFKSFAEIEILLNIDIQKNP